MSDTEVLIYDRDDLRPGDVLRVWPTGCPDRWAEGPIWRDSDEAAWIVGGRGIRYGDGEWVVGFIFDLAAHPARRTVPPVDEALVDNLATAAYRHLPTPVNFDRSVAARYIRALLATGRIEVKP